MTKKRFVRYVELAPQKQAVQKIKPWNEFLLEVDSMELMNADGSVYKTVEVDSNDWLAAIELAEAEFTRRAANESSS